MKRIRRILLISAVALMLWVAGRRAVTALSRGSNAGGHAAQSNVPAASVSAKTKGRAATLVSREEVPPLTRAEAKDYLRKLYRREQLTREIDLDQRRFGRNYWEPECDGVELRRIEAERATLLRQLTAEANEILAQLFPGGGDAIELPAFGDINRTSFNVSMLSAESRGRLEAALLAEAGESQIDAALSCAFARRILGGPELEDYLKWNSANSSFSREAMLGFNPSQAEFDLMTTDAAPAGPVTDIRAAMADAEAKCRQGLGEARFETWKKLSEPAMHTAVLDLRRQGLPLEQAQWLADTRTEAKRVIQDVWRDPETSTLAKEQKVAAIERDYGQTIAARLGLLASSLDELVPEPIK